MLFDQKLSCYCSFRLLSIKVFFISFFRPFAIIRLLFTYPCIFNLLFLLFFVNILNKEIIDSMKKIGITRDLCMISILIDS